jgi:hypothetical protein
MNLTLTQEKILSNLIYLYNKNDRPLQASEVAKTTGLNVGTIRNHMQILKMLKMTKGITGPKGGYIPTSKAFNGYSPNNKSNLNMYLNKIKLKDVTICEIRLNPKDNSTYSGSIKIIGNMEYFSVGDTVTIQTPNNNSSMIKGIITGRDFNTNTLFSSPIEILVE